MPRFWFSYCDHSGRLLGGLITDSPSLPKAQNRAGREGTEMGALYCEGYELDRANENLIPPDLIGRMLNREEVRKLVRGLETRIGRP